MTDVSVGRCGRSVLVPPRLRLLRLNVTLEMKKNRSEQRNKVGLCWQDSRETSRLVSLNKQRSPTGSCSGKLSETVYVSALRACDWSWHLERRRTVGCVTKEEGWRKGRHQEATAWT